MDRSINDRLVWLFPENDFLAWKFFLDEKILRFAGLPPEEAGFQSGGFVFCVRM